MRARIGLPALTSALPGTYYNVLLFTYRMCWYPLFSLPVHLDRSIFFIFYSFLILSLLVIITGTWDCRSTWDAPSKCRPPRESKCSRRYGSICNIIACVWPGLLCNKFFLFSLVISFAHNLISRDKAHYIFLISIIPGGESGCGHQLSWLDSFPAGSLPRRAAA